jgi:hypothetical protein
MHGGEAPVLAQADIVVVGAGSAGCAAALAARSGGRHSVLLVERYGFLGGISTQSLDTFYGFFTPGERPLKVVGGIPDVVVDRLHRTGDMFLRPNTYGAGTGVTYNPERLKLVWDTLMEEAGVRVLLHSLLLDAELSDGTGTLVLHTPGGPARVRARRLIDASGDAALCSLLGLPAERAGELAPAQTMTTTFRMCGVDLAEFGAAGGNRMLQERMAAAVEGGTHALPRKKGSLHAMVQPGCVSTVAVRVAGVDALDAESLGRGEREGRRQAFLYEDFLRSRVPGFRAARIISLSSPTIGIRESRRVYGEYRLTEEDCLTARMFDDRVLLCGAPIEDHRAGADGEEETLWRYVPGGGAYGVPYGTLVPRGQDAVWVAGRCFSATHMAHASCRSMGQTMSMGQAAGAAAAISLERDTGARGVEAAALQARLRSLGAVLDLPAAPARVGAGDWGKS